VLLHYLGKQKAENCIFLLKFWEFFASRHRKYIHIITWSQLNRPLFSQESAVCTKQDQWSEYSMLLSDRLPHTHRSPSLWWCRSLCQKWELFLVEPHVKSQRTVLVGYLTISTNVSCYQTLCRQQYYLPFSNIAYACPSAWCAQHSLTAAVQNSQLHFSWVMTPTGKSWTQLITRFRMSISATIWVSTFKSTKLKKSSCNWLNSGKKVIQHLS